MALHWQSQWHTSGESSIVLHWQSQWHTGG
jgi:hypothetical protein